MSNVRGFTVRLVVWLFMTWFLSLLWALTGLSAYIIYFVVPAAHIAIAFFVYHRWRRQPGCNDPRLIRWGLVTVTMITGIVLIADAMMLLVAPVMASQSQRIVARAVVTGAALDIISGAYDMAVDSGGPYPSSLTEIVESGRISADAIDPLQLHGDERDPEAGERRSMFRYYGAGLDARGADGVVVLVSQPSEATGNGSRLIVGAWGERVWVDDETYRRIRPRIEANLPIGCFTEEKRSDETNAAGLSPAGRQDHTR